MIFLHLQNPRFKFNMNKYMFSELDVYENEGNCWYFTTNFHKFSLLRKEINLKERSQTGGDQQLAVSPTVTIQTPEIDTSPVNTMTVFQSARPGTNTNETTTQSMERVPQEVVNPRGSVGNNGNTDINLYCENKLQWLNEGDLQTLVKVSEESIAKILGGPNVGEGVVDKSIHVVIVGDREEECQ